MLLATFSTRMGVHQLALYEQTDIDYLPKFSLYLLDGGHKLDIDVPPDSGYLICMFAADMWGITETGDADMDGCEMAADIGGRILAALEMGGDGSQGAAYHIGQIAEQLQILEDDET